MEKLYKGKYSIAVYNKITETHPVDDLVDIFDSAEEFAEFVGSSLQKVYSMLNKHFHNKCGSDIVVGNKMFELAFINLQDC